MRANYFLILACILASAWAWQQPPTFAERALIFSSTNLTHGRLWTLFPALFVHASPLHLFGNMLFLFVFGNTLEKNRNSMLPKRCSGQHAVPVRLRQYAGEKRRPGQI